MNTTAAARIRRCHKCPECVGYPCFNAERCKAQGEADLTQVLLEDAGATCPQGYWAGLKPLDRAKLEFQQRESRRAQKRMREVVAWTWVLEHVIPAGEWLAFLRGMGARECVWIWPLLEAAHNLMKAGTVTPPEKVDKLAEEMCLALAQVGGEQKGAALEQITWAFEAGVLTEVQANTIEAKVQAVSITR